MLANFSRGDFLWNPTTISKFSKTKGESSSCVCVLHKRDIKRKFDVVVMRYRQEMYEKVCSTCSVIVSLIKPVLLFLLLRFMNSNVYDSKSIKEKSTEHSV